MSRRWRVTSLLRIDSLKKYYPIRNGFMKSRNLHAVGL